MGSGRGGAGEVKGERSRVVGKREGRKAGSPLTPGPQRCYQARPGRKILPRSLHIPGSAGLVLQPRGAARTLFMAAPFSSPCLQAPKASGQAEGGLWGQGSPAQLPSPSFEPCWVPEGGGWVRHCLRPLPGSWLCVWEGGGRPPRQGPPPETSESHLYLFLAL